MKVGYSVEGSTDRAFLQGLKRRWCPHAELPEGTFRGTSQQSRRRELRTTCLELKEKGADIIIILTNAHDNWRAINENDLRKVLEEMKQFAICGVPVINIESWIVLDRDYIADSTNVPQGYFADEDPKKVFEHYFQEENLTAKKGSRM